MHSVNPYDMIHCSRSLYHIMWYTVAWLPETEVFPIPPGPRMHTQEVFSCRSNCTMPLTKSSRPWKISGFIGISCRASVSDPSIVPALLSFIRIFWISSTLLAVSSTLLAVCFIPSCISSTLFAILLRWVRSSWSRFESWRSLASWRKHQPPEPKTLFIQTHREPLHRTWKPPHTIFDSSHIEFFIKCFRPSILRADFRQLFSDCFESAIIPSANFSDRNL